jgi:hypothetical protein
VVGTGEPLEIELIGCCVPKIIGSYPQTSTDRNLEEGTHLIIIR